jgi:hypothetical protein
MNNVDRVEVVDAALSERDGDVIVYQPLNEDAAYASLRSRGVAEKRTQVPCLTLDEICRDLSSLTWIKMDVEGAEYRVLQGGTRTITRFWPDMVLEWHSGSLNEMGTQEEELRSLLVRWGYELFASCNNMGPLMLPTSNEHAHTVLATRRAGELKLAPWRRTFHQLSDA